MHQMISKSQFKPQALEYLRLVEEKKKPLIITHFGKPVIKITPYSEKSKKTEDILQSLRNSFISFKNPTDPVGVEDWEALK